MTPLQEAPTSLEALIEELARSQTDADRKSIVSRNKSLIHSEVVSTLAQKVVERVRVDTHQADALAEAALLIASSLNNKLDRAHALRAKANALYASGDHKGALDR